jgi:hypothetical protein
MERLSMLEWLPELGLLLVVSQGAGSLMVLRLQRNPDSLEYELISERRLPPLTPFSLVAGAHCI